MDTFYFVAPSLFELTGFGYVQMISQKNPNSKYFVHHTQD